jgi:hypothetical protein
MWEATRKQIIRNNNKKEQEAIANKTHETNPSKFNAMRQQHAAFKGRDKTVETVIKSTQFKLGATNLTDDDKQKLLDKLTHYQKLQEKKQHDDEKV